MYAASKFLERDAKVETIVASLADLVSGMLVQRTNKDQSRTYASIYMHENRVIIAEATVPKGYPPPIIFQQALGWLDDEGRRVRYQFPYDNDPDVPEPQGRGLERADIASTPAS